MVVGLKKLQHSNISFLSCKISSPNLWQSLSSKSVNICLLLLHEHNGYSVWTLVVRIARPAFCSNFDQFKLMILLCISFCIVKVTTCCQLNNPVHIILIHIIFNFMMRANSMQQSGEFFFQAPENVNTHFICFTCVDGNFFSILISLSLSLSGSA